jgi:hypothetical protein
MANGRWSSQQVRPLRSRAFSLLLAGSILDRPCLLAHGRSSRNKKAGRRPSTSTIFMLLYSGMFLQKPSVCHRPSPPQSVVHGLFFSHPWTVEAVVCDSHEPWLTLFHRKTPQFLSSSYCIYQQLCRDARQRSQQVAKGPIDANTGGDSWIKANLGRIHSHFLMGHHLYSRLGIPPAPSLPKQWITIDYHIASSKATAFSFDGKGKRSGKRLSRHGRPKSMQKCVVLYNNVIVTLSH